MTLFNVSATMAFTQGLLSFFSPCVFPLIPAYLTYLSGTSLDGLNRSRWLLLRNACFYVLGFSLVFILMGATATALGAFLSKHAALLRRIAGIVLMVFGLLMLFPLPFLQRERRLPWEMKTAGMASSCIMGMVFAFGWSPCIGPVLTSVLLMAGSTQSLAQGVGLLALYSLGLGIPFLLMALMANLLRKPLAALKRHTPTIKKVSAVLLMIMGILMLTDTFTKLAML